MVDPVEKNLSAMIDDLLAPEDIKRSELEDASLELSSLNSALNELLMPPPRPKIEGVQNDDLTGLDTTNIPDRQRQPSGRSKTPSNVKAESWDTGGY